MRTGSPTPCRAHLVREAAEGHREARLLRRQAVAVDLQRARAWPQLRERDTGNTTPNPTGKALDTTLHMQPSPDHSHQPKARQKF